MASARINNEKFIRIVELKFYKTSKLNLDSQLFL